jgi:hypothetical protein
VAAIKRLKVPDSGAIANPEGASAILGFYNDIDAFADRTKTIVEALHTKDRLLVVEFPEDKTYPLWLKAQYAFTINGVTSKCSTGTATATVKINGVALGGTANSVSSSEQSQAHTSANSVVAGDDVTVTFSSTSSCEDAQISVEYERV